MSHEEPPLRTSATGPGRRQVLAGATLLVAALGAPAMAEDAPGRAAFDFLHGRWRVTHRKLRERLAGKNDWFEFPGTLEVAPILGGLGNFDRNILQDPGGAYEASSLRLFDPKTGRWSIYWLDGRAPAVEPPVVGGFAGAKGTFYADDTFRGRAIRVRTTYESLGPGRAQWTQAFSPDVTDAWEVNWIMDFDRA
jgi:hypothetical protein